MVSRVDPRFFNFGDAFLGGIQQAQDTRRRDALLDLEQRQFGLQERQIANQERRLAQTDAERQAEMVAAQRKESIGLRSLAAARGDKASGLAVLQELGLPIQLADDPDAGEMYAALAEQFGGFKPRSGSSEPRILGPGSALIGPEGNVIAERPFAPANQTVIQLPEGQAAFNPRTGDVAPLSRRDDQRAADAADAEAEEVAKVTGREKAERPEKQRQMLTRIEKANADYDRMSRLANQIKNSPAVKQVTGLVGSNIPVIPGTQRADILRQIETLKSQAGFAILQDMRQSSPTGGALGQVSERELMFLQNNIANLERAQTPEQFLFNLQEFINWAENGKQRIRDAYQRDFGGKQSAPQDAGVIDFGSLPGG